MMDRIALSDLLYYKKSKAVANDFGHTGKYPVYSFRMGVEMLTDRPSLKGNGILISRFNEPQLKYVQGVFDVKSDSLFFMIREGFTLIPQYVYYYLLAHTGRLRRYYRGSSILSLAISEFLKMKIDVPPVAEQKRTVAILSGVDAAKGIRESQIAKFVKFPASYYDKMEKDSSYKYWEKTEIGNLLTHPKGIRYIQHMDEEPNEDDVILTVKGDAYVYASRDRAISCAKNSLCISINKNVCNPYYIAAVLNFDKKARAKMYGGSGRGNLSRADLEYVRLGLPSLQQQRDFESIMSKYYAIIAKMRNLDVRFGELRNALLWMFFHSKDRGNYGKMTAADFIDDLYNKVQDCDIAEYDMMRENVFQMLTSGKLEQYFDDTTKSIRLKEK